MDMINFVATLPSLFFKALNAGKTNASFAIASIILLVFGMVFIGVLLSNKKITRVAFLCQAILLATIFMIYDQWVGVILITVGIVYYRQKFSGKLV